MPRPRRLMIGIAATTAVAALVALVVLMRDGEADRRIEAELNEAIDALRPFPRRIDDATEILDARAEGRRMTYVYRVARDAPLDDIRLLVIAVTVLALGGIAWSTLGLWRVHDRSLTDDDFEYEHNTPEERHRFLSHVALMLSILSAVAVIYVAIPMLYLESCR